MGVDKFFKELLGGDPTMEVDPGSVPGKSSAGVADDNDEIDDVDSMEDDGIDGRNTQQAGPDKGMSNPSPRGKAGIQ